MAKLATPPAPPWIRMVSPGLSFNVSSTALSAVRPVSASAAAFTCDIASGFLATITALIATFSAYVPSCPASRTPNTASPVLRSLTPCPAALMTPEKSRPSANGNFAGLYWPSRTFQSAAFTLAATTSTTTAPGPATGSGKSPYLSTSGPPYCSMNTAFIGFAFLFRNSFHLKHDVCDEARTGRQRSRAVGSPHWHAFLRSKLVEPPGNALDALGGGVERCCDRALCCSRAISRRKACILERCKLGFKLLESFLRLRKLVRKCKSGHDREAGISDLAKAGRHA